MFESQSNSNQFGNNSINLKIMSLSQQFFEPQAVPNSITLRSFHTQRFFSESKDIGPWSTSIRHPTPREIRSNHHKMENSTRFRERFKTERAHNHSEQQVVKFKRFETHVFQFIDHPKIAQAYSLQKQRKSYAFRCFQLSDSLPFQKDAALKNPIEPVFISLLKYKKAKIKNRIKEVAFRLMKNPPKSTTTPSLSTGSLEVRKSKIVSLGYQKMNFKITSKNYKVAT